MSRLLPVTLLALLAGPLTQAPAKPPDLPVNPRVTCAVAHQDPEMPIDGLLVESTVEKPQCLLCDILMDVFFPPLRLRHIPAMMQCPCFKACCESMQKTVVHCCESMKHCQAAARQQQGHPTCPYCPSSNGCHGNQDDATENAGAQEEAEEPGEDAVEPEVIEVMPKEEPEQSDADTEEDSAPPKAESHAPVCPYLQKKACPPQGSAADPEACPKTPLDSFERLVKAGHLYRRAERYRLAGKLDRACRLYERAKKLCPGSRIEHLACTRLEQLYTDKAVENAQPAVEEAEPLPCKPAACGHHDQLRAACMAVVDELRAKASELLDEGHYVEGYELAEMAIKLSTDCEDAFTLLAKAHAALHAPKEANVCPEEATQEKAEEPKTEAGAGEDTEVMPPSEEPAEPPDCGPQTLVQPQLPPVDPAIVEALEKVLREVGDPAIPKLVIEVDEPAAEEQADPVSTWPYVPPQIDVPPSLLADPEDDDLALEDDDEGAASPEDQAWAYLGDHLEDMLRGTVESLRQHVCCDVDIDSPFGPRGRVNFQVGDVQCTLVCDGWGHRLFVVRLTPEATGDVRDLQQAHNDRVLHWIEVLNCGGNSSTDDDAAASEDDEDDDLLYYDEPYPL